MKKTNGNCCCRKHIFTTHHFSRKVFVFEDWNSRLNLLHIQIAKWVILLIYFIRLLYVPKSLLGHHLCWCTTVRNSYKVNHTLETGKILNLKWCHRKGSSDAFNSFCPSGLVSDCSFMIHVSYFHTFIEFLTIACSLKSDNLPVHVLQRDDLRHLEISSLLLIGLYCICACLPPMYCPPFSIFSYCALWTMNWWSTVEKIKFTV